MLMHDGLAHSISQGMALEASSGVIPDQPSPPVHLFVNDHLF